MISSFCSHEIFDVTKPYFSKRGDERKKMREKKKKLYNTLPSPRLVSVKKAAQVRLHKASLPYPKNSRGHLQSLFSSFSSSPSPHPLIIPLPPACTSPTQHLHLPISPISSAFSSFRTASACEASPQGGASGSGESEKKGNWCRRCQCQCQLSMLADPPCGDACGGAHLT